MNVPSRPIGRRSRVGFALVHGLAFAEVLRALGLRGTSLVSLLGFNLGIELTQLTIVALVMSSLCVLARHRGYAYVRTAVEVGGKRASSGKSPTGRKPAARTGTRPAAAKRTR